MFFIFEVDSVDNEQMEKTSEEQTGIIRSIFLELFTSPVNIVLMLIIAFIIHKLIKNTQSEPTVYQPEPELPKLKKKDFTIEELMKYDGTGPDGRILIAINGKIFDVTKGKRFYGPGGAYAVFAGRDASRGLATFSVSVGTEYDDLSDLNSVEMDSIKEWEMQFTERYDYIGKLLKPGQNPTNYSDEEEESSVTEEKADGEKPKAE